MRNKRLNSTGPTSESRLDDNGLELPMSQQDHASILERASQVWPAPAQIPAGWSSTWSRWPHLLTLYWLSPYYLMLPQIEMLLNIRYGVPGEARPVLFATTAREGAGGAFVFTIVPGEWAGDKGGGYYLLDGLERGGGELWHFEGVRSEEDLLSVMMGDPELTQAALVRVPVNEEGEEALGRVLARDETVIPLLAKRFLDYVPEATRIEEERGSVVEPAGAAGVSVGLGEGEKVKISGEEVLKMMDELKEDIEAKFAKDEKEEKEKENAS